MQGDSIFFQAFIYLTAAVVSVPVARHLGFGSVLGYLVAGTVIGPFGFGLIGRGAHDVMHFAEFGVVMMLFLIGLELNPSLLWRLRGPILGLGGLQVGLTTGAITAIGLSLGLTWQSAVAIGMILSLSSTAMVLQTLAEKGLMKTDAGQSAFSVLLFQDVAVIPMLALLPFLATVPGAKPDATWISDLPAWVQALVVLGSVTALVLVGRYLFGYAFRFIARAQLREIFTAAALLVVIGIALLMTKLGLSAALGTFLAGVVLAESEYRHELESDIEPFKGLFLGLFFIAVGTSIDFGLVAAGPAVVLSLVVGLVAVKFVVLATLARLFGQGTDQTLLFSFALAQGGEFAFVLLSYSMQNRVLSADLAGPLVAAVALSMALTPLVMLLNEKLVQPRFGTKERELREPDTIERHSPVIIAGFGNFGSIVGRFLRATGVKPTVLELDSDQVDLLRKLGIEAFYGDASRHDLLRAAGAAEAKVLILAVDDHEKLCAMVATAKRHFPHLTILARAKTRADAYGLLDAGVERVYRETLDTSLRVGVEALRLLGLPAHPAARAARTFRRLDEVALRELGRVHHDRKAYISSARDRTQDLEEVLRADFHGVDRELEAAWD